jgi:hypothetical protein
MIIRVSLGPEPIWVLVAFRIVRNSPGIEMQSSALWDPLPVVDYILRRDVRMAEGHRRAPSPELLHQAPDVGDALEVGEFGEAVAYHGFCTG